MKLMFRTPDMPRGKSTQGEFDTLREVEEFLKEAPGTMPDSTLFYTSSGPGEGDVWIIRGGEVLKVYNERIMRRNHVTMYQMIAAAPALSTEDLKEL